MKKLLMILMVVLASLIIVNASGEVEILASADSGDAPLTVSFDINGTAESYAWDLDGDGNTDSTEAEPRYTYTRPGTYTVSLNATIDEKINISTKRIIVKTPLLISVTANPSSGRAPLAVQFTLAATGKSPLTYSWDFNNDLTTDSIQQNPSYTYLQAGEYNVTVKVTDAEGNSAEKVYPLTVSKYDSHLNLTAYFPQTLTMGENQITLIVTNDGTEPAREISAKMVGIGVQHLTSSSIPLLQPGEQDSLTVKVRVFQGDESGGLSATAKVSDKNFPLAFKLAEEIKYNKEEIQNKLAVLKEQFKQQEDIYMDKKAKGYLVSEIFDNIKSIQKQIQDTQQFVLSGKYAEANINLDLIATAIADLTIDLEQSQKQKQTWIMWLKDNAIAITAIIAALGTLSGILLKLKSQAVKVKEQVKVQAQHLTENVKKKFPLKKNGSDGSEKKEESGGDESNEKSKEESKTDKESKEETAEKLK